MNAAQREAIRLASNDRASKRADRLGKIFVEKFPKRVCPTKNRTPKEKRILRRIIRSLIALLESIK